MHQEHLGRTLAVAPAVAQKGVWGMLEVQLEVDMAGQLGSEAAMPQVVLLVLVAVQLLRVALLVS